jgi:hypothetical protein
MSRVGSYAFRPGQAGSVMDFSFSSQPVETEPTADERELAMGYKVGSTAAWQVTERERCKALGQSMDANALQVLFTTAAAHWMLTRQPDAVDAHIFVSNETVKLNCQLLDTITQHQPFSLQKMTCMTAAAQEQAVATARGAGDVWLDAAVMQYLQQGELPFGASQAELGRIRRRSKSYYFVGELLIRRMPDQTDKVVPPLAERQQLIQQQHELCGHYGIRRTASLLLTKFWWYGLLADVSHMVNNCQHCSRVNASFAAKPEQLQSIPIRSVPEKC